MRIVIETDMNGLRRFGRGVQKLGDGSWRKEAARGVIDAGRKTETQVQRAVHGQMATRRYGEVSRAVMGTPNQADLSFRIWAVQGGQRIEEYKGLKSVKSGPLAGGEGGLVSSGVWNRPRTFQRSFAAAGGYFAELPGGQRSKVAPRVLWKPGYHPNQPRDDAGRFASSGRTYGSIRRLFGPSIRKEIVKDEALATFQRVAPRMLIEKVVPRIAKLITY